MGRLLNSMVEVRVLAVLQIALVACVIAVPAPLGSEVEMLQVAPDIMAVDSMDAMISSAMKAEVKADIGDANQSDEEMNEEEAEALKKIAEKKAIAAQLAASQKRDCITTQWTAWTKCSKKCGGGAIERKRTVTQHPANGGESCPTYDGMNDKMSCNTESCSDEEKDLANKRRHLTEDERATEEEANNQILARAKIAPTADRMISELNHWIKKDVKTSMVHVLLPGEQPPSDEEAIQDELKKAIAKNTISTAMAGFETQSAAQQVVHQTAQQQAVHAASARVVDNNLQPLVEQTAQPTAN